MAYRKNNSVSKAQKNAKKYGIKTYNIRKNRNYKNVQKDYIRLIGIANQRLRQIEKDIQNPLYSAMENYAYRDAMQYINRLDPNKELKRFSGAVKHMNKKELEKNVNAVLTFLNSPTSTKSGTRKVYQKRANTFNRKYGTNFSVEDLHYFFTNEHAENLFSKYGSKTALKKIGELQKDKKEIIENVKKTKNKHVINYVKKEVNEEIFDSLKKAAVTVLKL